MSELGLFGPGACAPAHRCLAVKLKLDIIISSVIGSNSLVLISVTSGILPRLLLDWRGTEDNTLHEYECRD